MSYGNSHSNTRHARVAWSEMAYQDKQWHESMWTRKTCAICSDPRYQLHHVNYKPDHPAALAHLVPLCDFHHRDFTHNVWQRLQGLLTLTNATLFYVVHGTATHEYLVNLKVSTHPHPGVSAFQLALFD
jgi:hypothetical protein